MQGSDRREQNAGGGRPGTGGDVPKRTRLIPSRALHLGVETNFGSKLVLVGDIAEVVPQFRLRRIQPAPVISRSERKRVEVGGNVAGAAGIAIIAPGASDVGSLLDDQKRVL